MNQNRTMMMGRLHDLKARRKAARKLAKNSCNMIMPMINPMLSPVEELDIAGAAAAMDELVMHQADLLSLGAKIRELEEALYG